MFMRFLGTKCLDSEIVFVVFFFDRTSFGDVTKNLEVYPHYAPKHWLLHGGYDVVSPKVESC